MSIEMDQSTEDDWDDEDTEEDGVEPSEVARAVVTGTDWTTETILSQLRRGNIQLNPRFQRRDAWDLARKSRFIESLILGFPIPQLVLAEDNSRRGAFVVLDGKQRLLSLRQFASDSGVTPGAEEYTKLRLRGLDVRPDLSGYTLAKLEADKSKIDDLNAFLNQPIRTVVVRNWPNEQFLNVVFLRLNTGSVKLSAQELRQALHPGPFTDFLDDYSADSQQLRRALKLKRPDFRMRDVEVALRFFAFNLFLGIYKGDLKKLLDSTTGTLNATWSKRESDLRALAAECDNAIEATFEIFGSNAFKRWTGGVYIPQFNRAVFDIMAFYFKYPNVRAAAIGAKDELEQAYRDLCKTDREFTESIQTTTKSISATELRLSRWRDVLTEVLGQEVPPAPGVGTTVEN